jgi:hypothetical protein
VYYCCYYFFLIIDRIQFTGVCYSLNDFPQYQYHTRLHNTMINDVMNHHFVLDDDGKVTPMVTTSSLIAKRRTNQWIQRRKQRCRGMVKFHMKRFQGQSNSPQPAVTLSQSQCETIKDYSLFVELQDVTRGNLTGDRFFRPVWKVKDAGKKWVKKDGRICVPKMLGAIVTDASSMAIYRQKLPKESSHNIKFMGATDSNVVLLAVWRRQPKKRTESTEMPFTEHQIRWMRKFKYNILRGKNNHHGSGGKYFGFGIRKSTSNLAWAKNHSSLDEYYLKPGASMNDRMVNQERQKQVCAHLQVAKANIEQAFSGATGTSAVTVGNQLAESMLKALYCSNSELEKQHPALRHSWFPSGFACLDAFTEFAHTEPDQTYTLLHCPPQESLEYEDPSGTTFNFYLDGGVNDYNTMKIPLNIGTSVFFSGFFLLHRQERHSDTQLLNLGAYGNQKVYQFGRQTLIRNINNRHALRAPTKTRNGNLTNLI